MENTGSLFFYIIANIHNKIVSDTRARAILKGRGQSMICQLHGYKATVRGRVGEGGRRCTPSCTSHGSNARMPLEVIKHEQIV